jgi:small-conductance mechanosensitive channel
LAKATLPLGQESVFLESSRTNLLAWRGALGQSFHNILRHLLIRVGGMVLAMLVVLGISRVWKRATFRYVADPRRRAQFLMLRRIVVGVMIGFILLATVVTEFGSIATFAGLITAGIAVALQTVILSGVAYFFFIGRYGVRVGERVTISGITGDVIDLGLFRLYLMELAGSGRDLSPTGRVVVFSNAVLFQPQAFFKQIPGADFNWHEVSITLAPDTDPQVAETKLLGGVQSVYNEYRENLERQYNAVKTTMHVPIPPPHPESRLRFVDTGLEFVIRYPVDIHKSAEIDDKVTRKLLDLIRTDPALKLAGAGMPKVRSAGAK